jgi:hypothetical protein
MRQKRPTTSSKESHYEIKRDLVIASKVSVAGGQAAEGRIVPVNRKLSKETY